MSAATLFRAIAELLEIVLLDLQPRDLLLSQRVNRTFRSVIVGSPVLQRKLFLLPEPTPAGQHEEGRGPGQLDPNTKLQHNPTNRGECDQNGDDRATHYTREINGKIFTLHRARAVVGAAQPWRCYIVTKRGQWQRYSKPNIDWSIEGEVERLNRWREQSLSRNGWNSKRDAHPRYPETLEYTNTLLDSIFEKILVSVHFRVLRLDEAATRPEASWRLMFATHFPESAVEYVTKHDVCRKGRCDTAIRKVVRRGGVRAGDVFDDALATRAEEKDPVLIHTCGANTCGALAGSLSMMIL